MLLKIQEQLGIRGRLKRLKKKGVTKVRLRGLLEL